MLLNRELQHAGDPQQHGQRWVWLLPDLLRPVHRFVPLGAFGPYYTARRCASALLSPPREVRRLRRRPALGDRYLVALAPGRGERRAMAHKAHQRTFLPFSVSRRDTPWVIALAGGRHTSCPGWLVARSAGKRLPRRRAQNEPRRGGGRYRYRRHAGDAPQAAAVSPHHIEAVVVDERDVLGVR